MSSIVSSEFSQQAVAGGQRCIIEAFVLMLYCWTDPLIVSGGLGFAGGVELELCVLTLSFWDDIHWDEWCEQNTERISNKEKN